MLLGETQSHFSIINPMHPHRNFFCAALGLDWSSVVVRLGGIGELRGLATHSLPKLIQYTAFVLIPERFIGSVFRFRVEVKIYTLQYEDGEVGQAADREGCSLHVWSYIKLQAVLKEVFQGQQKEISPDTYSCWICLKTLSWMNAFIQQTFIEHVLNATHCPRHWRYSSEQNRQDPYSKEVWFISNDWTVKDLDFSVISYWEWILSALFLKEVLGVVWARN